MYPKRQSFFVLGLSRSGCAVSEFLLSENATVYIYDDVDAERTRIATERLVALGAKSVKPDELEGITAKCDAIVLSPGIPIDHKTAVAFKRAGKAVMGETEIAARYIGCPMIAVTGTNGKTTTVSLIEKVLSNNGIRSMACGNIGTPLIKAVDADIDVAVSEISSFQLETLSSVKPHIAVVLNITEDHLNRHYNMENYVYLKARLLKNCAETEYAVLNFDDPIVRNFAQKTKATVVWFSRKEKVRGAYVENGKVFWLDTPIMSVNDIPLLGEHNLENVLSCVAVCALMGIPYDGIKKQIADFRGIPHRNQTVTTVDGVKYINDSKGTNVDATQKAIDCMKEETVLLLGGKDKGYNYDSLFSSLSSSKVVCTVLYGENRLKLLESAVKCGYNDTVMATGFSTAVQFARIIAKSGQCVLLSPASSSFDEFGDYEERGDTFVKTVFGFKAEERARTNNGLRSDSNERKSNGNEFDDAEE